jgi:hypothetical protein
MNTQKILRDVIIVVIVILLAIVVLKTTGPGSGPVERAHGEGGAHGMAGQDGMGDAPHMDHGPSLQLSDGEAIVTYGDHVVGRDWYDNMVAKTQAEFMAAGQDEEAALVDAMELSLMDGLIDIVLTSTAEEYDISVDDAYLEQMEQGFYASFESEDAANQVLIEMGVTMDRLHLMWTEDELKNRIYSKVAELNELDPESPESEQAFNDFLEEKLVMTEWVITDPEIEAVYLSYIDAVIAGDEMDDTHSADDGHGHGEEMMNPHGGMDMEEEQEGT